MSAVRNALNAARYDWLGVRIGGPGASMQGLWPALIVTIALVFGAFFLVGRLLANGGIPGEGSSAAPLTHAAIPGGLKGGSPIAGDVPSAITSPPPRRKQSPASGAAVLRATAPSRTFTPEASSGSVASASPEQSAPVSEPAPSPAPASTGAGSHASGGGGAHGGANGGGSFDSSE